MLRLESEDLCVDMSGFESVEAIAGIIEVQTLIRRDDHVHKCSGWCFEALPT